MHWQEGESELPKKSPGLSAAFWGWFFLGTIIFQTLTLMYLVNQELLAFRSTLPRPVDVAIAASLLILSVFVYPVWTLSLVWRRFFGNSLSRLLIVAAGVIVWGGITFLILLSYQPVLA